MSQMKVKRKNQHLLLILRLQILNGVTKTKREKIKAPSHLKDQEKEQ